MKSPSAPIDASRLDVTVTEGARCRRTVRVAVPPDVVDEERLAVMRKYSARVKMRGFRKGRVPVAVILQHYGGAIEREAVESCVKKTCDAAIAANGLHPVSDVEVKDLDLASGKSVSFEASFDVRPEVPLNRLGGFRVERPRADVPEGAAGEILERLRRQHAAWRTEESGSPVAGDSVTVLLSRLDGEATEPGEAEEPRQYDIVLGEGQALPDIEDAIGTLAPGEVGDFRIAFPDDFDDEERRGQAHHLRIELESRRAPELPELDDAFARTVGDFEDLAALRERVEEDLERDARERSEGELRDRLVQLVVEANDFDVPDSMVEDYTDLVIGDANGVDPKALAELREELRPAAQAAAKRDLLVARIVEEHDLRATAEEVRAQVDELARESNQSAGRLHARLKKSGGLRNIERALTDARLFEFLKSRSEITETK